MEPSTVDLGQITNNIHMSIPVSQVQYYTTREGTTVAIAQKTGSGTNVSGSETVSVPVSAVTSGGTTSFQINADTLQLMGMAAQLPNSNLFVNYPHTMWERDAEGNRILVQSTSVAGPASAAAGQPGVKTEAGDALSQAAAVIKNEVAAPVKTVTVPVKSFVCEICNKGFAKREHLTKHTRIHKDTKRYTCDYCQKQFRDRYELVRHQRRHTGDFPFRCNDCSKGFMRHERYMTHLRWHSGERPFQCGMCEKSFRDRSELNRHSRRHTGDLPYKCQTCGKGFLRRERYVTHTRIHTGEKPFVCGVCNRGYRDKRELKKHQATHNHGEPSSPQQQQQAVVVANLPVSPSSPGPQHVTVVPAPQPTQPRTASKPVQVQVQQPASTSSSQMATITFNLPTEPVPKNQLGIPQQPQQTEPQYVQPLNPAQITLPPSVASALQNMNQKAKPSSGAGAMVAVSQASTPVKQEQPMQVLKQVQIVDGGDGQQLIATGGSLPPGLIQAGTGSAAHPQFFYCIVPGAVQYPAVAEGGSIRVSTAEGGTAQLVTLPPSAFQAAQIPGSSVDADLKLHDSSEEIACARELLTLGQHDEVKRDSFIVSKETNQLMSSYNYNNNITNTGPVQRLIVAVPTMDQNMARSHVSGLNLDGNITESSEDSSTDIDDDEEDEEEDDDDTTNNVVSKVFSISQLLLSRNSAAACPKSTVEDSCCTPPLLNKEFKKSLTWTRRKKLKERTNAKDLVLEQNSRMNGGTSPILDPSVRPCKVILPRLSVETPDRICVKDNNIINNSENLHQDQQLTCVESELIAPAPLYSADHKPCDKKMSSNMNHEAGMSGVSTVSVSSNPSFQTPQPTFISSNPLGQLGSTTISTVTSQVMAMPLPQNPVLVLSGANNLTNAATVVTSGGLPTNLVLSSFPGSAPMQMTAIPISKGILGVGGPQAINIQTSDVIKVPVALNGGGQVVLAPAPVSLPHAIAIQPAPAPVAVQPPAHLLPPTQQAQAAAGQPDQAVGADQKLEPSYGDDGSVEWKCKVCAKVCASEHELSIHKKRHKIDDPLVCGFCQRTYVDQHRYAVHVRTHTGETPFHCELCGKGFRDDRKMKLHMARHNSGLSHKCHLCPRSFEGPKALEKHLNAHEKGRFVAPKVIQRQDGTLAMALPEDPNQTKKVEGSGVLLEASIGKPATVVTGDIAPVTILPQPTAAPLLIQTSADQIPETLVVPKPLLTSDPTSTTLTPSDSDAQLSQPKVEDGGSSSQDPGMISLSVDDLYQYSVTQTNVDTQPNPENVDIHDKLSEGAAKIVPLGLDEFMTGTEVKQAVKEEKKVDENDSGDFPDLLDSDHSLATLNSNFDYNQYNASDEKIDQLLKTATIKEEEGLTFATLGGLDPMYNDVDLSSLTPVKQEPVVVAKKSVAPALDPPPPPVLIKEEEPLPSPININPPSAVTLTPAPTLEPPPAPVTPAIIAPPPPPSQDPGSLTFTIQYQTQPSVPQLPTQPDPSVIKEDPDNDLDNDPASLQNIGDISQIKPILPPVDPNAKDPTKETFTYTTNTGQKIEVPTIITSGYDFDNLLCLFCDRQQFKNDKTLINHLLNHFGVAPKMATCPICGLSLQKKSFARHVRLHGDVKPEVCPYCKKEFREKRSLDKHIRAIHEAERPFPCEHCTESFRNQIELKNHINRHLKDYPFKCDVCSMTFQKQEALTTHYRNHTGEKPFTCPICDKTFTSEKNKRVHVLRHQGSLPHKCDVCDMTFQSRSHLMKHATSHNRKTQVISAKINTFLESFGASLEEFGLDDSYDGAGNDISLHSATESGEIEDASIRLSVDNLPDTDNLEAAAAEAAFAFGGDLPDDFIKFDGTESVDSSEKSSDFGTPEPPIGGSGSVSSTNTGSAPSLVHGMTEDEAERLAKAELAAEIPLTADGTYLCKYCNTKLGNKRSYIIHLRRHAGMLNFKCKYCTKTFQGRVKLNRHMNTHFRDGSNVTPPPAPAAGSESSSGSTTTTINTSLLLPPPPPAATGLSTATTTITPVPAASPSVVFNCTMCSKIFSDKETLQEHTRMHLIADVKAKFSSPVSKEKTKSSNLSTNSSSVSSDSKETKYSYTCNLCNQTFLDNEQWKVHKTSHGNKTWKCKFCNVLLEDKSILANHLSESHSISRDEAESSGLLRAVPLVIMMAVADTQDVKQTKLKESDSEDSDEDLAESLDIMPKHFDKDDAFFTNLSTVSRSNSAASLDSDVRPASACTDSSDISMNTSFDLGSSGTEVDESSFDAATLTCKICKKVLKNMRTFRNHKARHLGTLNHKCPDCSKCFEGRSAVNRHLISNHNRELQPHEITNNPAAASTINIIRPSAPEIKLFKPSEMAKKSTKPAELPIPARPMASIPPPDLEASSKDPILTSSPIPPHLDSSAPVLEKQVGVPDNSNSLCQMPILLENPETEVRYIVGSQLKPSEANSPERKLSMEDEEEEEEIKDPDANNFSEPLSTSSPRRSSPIPEDSTIQNEEDEKNESAESDKSVNNSKLPQKLANFERIIPESDDSDSDKSDSDSSTSSDDDDSSDSDSDDDFIDEEATKNSKKKPEEITIDDEDEENRNNLNKSDSNQYHNVFESFLNKSKEESESDLEEDPMEQKRRTRQTSRKAASPEKKAKVITMDPDAEDICDPLIEGHHVEEGKEKELKSTKNRTETLSDEDSYHSEDEVIPAKKSRSKVKQKTKEKKPKSDEDSSFSEEEVIPAKKSRSKVKQQTKENKPHSDEDSSISEEEIIPVKKSRSKVEEQNKEDKPNPTKVSMVAAIFRAKKKKQTDSDSEATDTKIKKMATRVLLPKGPKKLDVSVSESDSEKEKEKTEGNTSDIPLDKEAQDEADKLLEQKGVAVVGGKLMIPADKLKIPDELCLIKSGKGRGSKKTFICQICDKQFNRQDKMKYHLFNEHYDDFIRCSDSVPKILAKNYASVQESKSPKVETKGSPAAEKERTSISKPSALARIFAMKNKTKMSTSTKSNDVASDEKKTENSHALESQSLTIDEEPVAKTVDVVDTEIKKESPKSNLHEKSQKSSKRKSPRRSTENLFEKLTNDEKKGNDSHIDEKPVRKPRSSPRGSRFEEDSSLVTTKERTILAPPSMKLSSMTMTPTVLPQVKASVFGQDPFANSLDNPDIRNPFQANQMKTLDEPGILSTTNNFELKFGSDKNLVTFADLAMKSKEQTHDPILKPKGRPGRPKKVGKKKLSARVSVEQSPPSIEDTPTLIALQAAKEAEMEDKEEIEESDSKSEHLPTANEEQGETSVGPKIETLDMFEEDKKVIEDSESRPTRSKLHVDTIGLSSSTLDLELHALRNLVFGEILETKPEEMITDITESNDEVDIIKGEEVVNSLNESLKEEYSEPVYFEDLPIDERFTILGERIINGSKYFATAIWHERKRLRLQKRKELNALLEKINVEKRAKFKPKRHDFTLKLLCSTNLYNNILIETERILKELEESQFLVKNCSSLVHKRQQLYSVSKRLDEKILLKRLRREKYSCKSGENMKLILSKRKSKKNYTQDNGAVLAFDENSKSETKISIESEVADVKIKASDFRNKMRQKKGPSPKKFKVTKVTWGQVPESEHPKVPKKRGRKKKLKVEDVEKPKAKRGRKPKSLVTDEKEKDSLVPSKVGELSNTSNSSKMKRSRKGRPRKLTNEDVVKCKQLDIQVVKDDKKADKQVEHSDSATKLDCENNETPADQNEARENIFEFNDNDDKNSVLNSPSTSYKRTDERASLPDSKKVEDDCIPVKRKKIKRCEFLDGSGDEHQVPLKITFKRQSPEGSSNGKLRKSIKLRVKTQTTRDNGLKIQIKQPKTDNPLKFKVKAGSKENKRKRFKLRNIPISDASKESSIENVCTSQPLDKLSCGEAQQTRESNTTTTNSELVTGVAPLAVSETSILPIESEATAKKPSVSSPTCDYQRPDENVDEPSVTEAIKDKTEISDSKDLDVATPSTAINDEARIEAANIIDHLTEVATEEKILQLDGDDDLCLDEDDLPQLDGSYDGFYKVPRGCAPQNYTKVSPLSSRSCVTVLSDSPSSQSTGVSVPAASGAPSSGSVISNSSSNRQLKRDRSVSDDSNEGGDNPNKKKHQCHICNKLFPNSFRLKTHFRVHTGEKPYKCDPCNQAFADRSNYVKHKQTKSHKNKVDIINPLNDQLTHLGRSSVSVLSAQNSRQLSGQISVEASQEVPSFEFLDSPGTFNQHDLDSHVPIDGYDTDDSLPMTFDDMDDVSLAAEYYMLSSQVDGEQDLDDEEDDGLDECDMFSSQVDGEQDLIESAGPKKPSPVINNISLNVVNGVTGLRPNGTSTSVVKVEPAIGGNNVLMNGNSGVVVNGGSGVRQNSILARHLGQGATSPAPDTQDTTYSCDMCSAKLKNKRNFDTHMKRHRGELPFKCDECPKTFQGRRDLETHKRSRHDNSKKILITTNSSSVTSTPRTLSPVAKQKTIVLSMNSIPNPLMQENVSTVLIKQDPVMVANHKDEPPDPDTDFILQDSLPLFDNSIMDSTDSAVNLSLDDLTGFTQPLGGSIHSSGGMCQADNSFDASMDGSASFLSGADMSTDTFDLVGDSASESGYTRTPSNSGSVWLDSRDSVSSGRGTGLGVSLSDIQSEGSVAVTSPFTPRSGSGTPSLPDEGEFPCPQCDKRFGNRRNLMSHMRRHTGDYKLFCDSCGKGFFTQSKLDSHKRKHTGEKPFRCLFSSCLKRFRYKGDLSKHIKRYHPGHSQALTPVPLQDDEIAALANAQHQQQAAAAAASKQKVIVVTGNTPPCPAPAPVQSTLRTVLTTGLRPQQLVLQPMQPPTYRLVSQTSSGQSHQTSANPGTIIPDNDPSLDENLLNILAADGDEDDPMLSPAVSVKTLAGLNQNNTALVLPNTVFSSKPISNQDVGVFLQSSGKSSGTLHLDDTQKATPSSSSQSKPVILTSTSGASQFVLPKSTSSIQIRTANGSVTNPAMHIRTNSNSGSSSYSSSTSSQTLRSLLSSTPQNLPVSQTLILSPLTSGSNKPVTSSPVMTSTSYQTATLVNPPPLTSTSKLSESFLPADISFTSSGDRDGVNTDTVTLTLDDIMSYSTNQSGQEENMIKERLNPPGSDRESDLTSPGSVRSELTDTGKSEEGDPGPDKLFCQFPGCSRSFDRPNLLKRHMKIHSGECRFVCDVCKKNFESGSKLEDHYRRHTGERPFQCHVCGNKFRYKGDRTKHLKNLHGIHKSLEPGNSLVSVSSSSVSANTPIIINGTSETYNLARSKGPASTSSDKTPFLTSITEETNSSISSFQSNTELSDSASLSSSNIGESPHKFDPLDVGSCQLLSSTDMRPMSSSGYTNGMETVTMSIDEVMQYAQPIADFTF